MTTEKETMSTSIKIRMRPADKWAYERECTRVKADPADVTRCSWMSYYYELTADAALVSAEGGHSGGTGVFFRHYRALVRPGDGKRWFGIRPRKV